MNLLRQNLYSFKPNAIIIWELHKIGLILEVNVEKLTEFDPFSDLKDTLAHLFPICLDFSFSYDSLQSFLCQLIFLA